MKFFGDFHKAIIRLAVSPLQRYPDGEQGHDAAGCDD
jgi:hypothetical protein